MRAPRTFQSLRIANHSDPQSVAAAGTHYEDIYCLGVHARTDPGQCVVDATKPAKGVRRASLD